MFSMFWSTVIFVFCDLVFVSAQISGDDTKTLVTTLLSNYNKKVRPNLDHSRPMQVYIDMTLVGVNGLDAKSGMLTTTGYLDIYWTDEYLTWDSTTNYVYQIYLSQSDIWKPDITLENGFSKLSELGSDFVQVKILSSGWVLWQPFEVFNSKCNIDITFFPFDQQNCDLKFVVWSSSIADVNVTMFSKSILLENIEDTGEWKIVSSTSSEDKDATESKVTYSITLERNSQYYIFNIIVPIVLLGLLNVMTYVIPADSGEKMGYAMTVFLSFAVFLTIVSSELPRSTGSYLGYYLMLLLALGVITVVSTALQLRIRHRPTEVPKWIAGIIECRCYCCKKNQVDDDANLKCSRKTTWADVTTVIDQVMFWTLITLFLGSTIGVMAALQNRIKLA